MEKGPLLLIPSTLKVNTWMSLIILCHKFDKLDEMDKFLERQKKKRKTNKESKEKYIIWIVPYY